VASDLSKGVAIETDKLKITEDAHKQGAEERPAVERFFTAVQM